MEHSNTAVAEIRALMNGILGQKVKHTQRRSKGTLALEFGQAFSSHNEKQHDNDQWLLSLYGCVWRIEENDQPLIASGDEPPEIEKALQRLEGLTLQAYEIVPPALDATFFFAENVTLRLFSICTEVEERGYRSWILFTPQHVITIYGDGDWDELDSEENRIAVQARRRLADIDYSLNENDELVSEDAQTKITRLPVSFFPRFKIYQVKHTLPFSVDVFYLGYARGEVFYLLTGAPQNYLRLAHKEQVQLNTPELVLAYARVYLITTHSTANLWYIVDSVADVRFRQKLESEGEERKKAFLQQYQEHITAPEAEVTESGYSITLYIMQQRDLEMHTLQVTAEGDIEEHVTTLEKGLPVVYSA